MNTGPNIGVYGWGHGVNVFNVVPQRPLTVLIKRISSDPVCDEVLISFCNARMRFIQYLLELFLSVVTFKEATGLPV
jgi:hypothetical protein